MSYQVKLEEFEGPLDLLLHLIRKNELDIYNISVSAIANQYLAYVEMMQSLNLDGVGDFLVMAAMLAYYKSKMLLPTPPDEEADEDGEFESLEELRRRLIEYQRFKEVAEELGDRERLDRDVFAVRVEAMDGEICEGEAPIRATLFDLLDAFNEIIKRLPEERVHDVIPERVRLVDRIMEVLDLLSEKGAAGLLELVGPEPTRARVVVTLLAVLELVRLKSIRAYQSTTFGAIQLRLVGGDDVDHKKKVKEGIGEHES